MSITRQEKEQIVNGFKDRLNNIKAMIFTDYQGIKVNEMQELRKKLREKGIDYKVLKTTLIKKALENSDVSIDESIYTKPVALAISEADEVEPSKVIYEYSKGNDKLEILGAIVNGEFYNAAQVKSLALMPSREELYAKVVGSISAPLCGFVNVLGGNLRGLVNVLKQYQESRK